MKVILILSLLALPLLITAQGLDHNPCATDGAYPEWLAGYMENPNRPTARSNEIIYLPITMHSVGKTDGSGHYPTLRIFESFCRLNEDFEPYGIQFFLKGPINIINRDLYYEHENFGDGSRMMKTYRKSLTINVFITNKAPSNACGYWHQSENAIVVIKNCMGGSGHTLTHEVGHWLSLPHTFYGWEGKTYDAAAGTPLFHSISGKDTLFVENAIGNNCGKAGDRFCDTPADYLSFGWACNGSFQSQIQKDPYGVDFRSDASNFMSYSVDACQSKFSNGQQDAMLAFIKQVRSEYVSNAIPIGPVSSEPMTFVSPEPNSQVNYQSINLQWNHHPNATHYLVNISKFSFFVTIDYEFIVEGNSINIGDLPVDRKWYWRVKPYNPYKFCAGFTEAGDFSTYDITSVDEINESNKLEIYPTLVSADRSSINVDFDFNDLLTAQLEVYATTGQLMRRQLFVNPGRSVQQIQTEGLPSGLYLLKISTEKGNLVKRITIQ